jgi:hypothetical protein
MSGRCWHRDVGYVTWGALQLGRHAPAAVDERGRDRVLDVGVGGVDAAVGASAAERAHQGVVDQVLGLDAIAREDERVSEQRGTALADERVQGAGPGAHGAILA